jgi:hypothetical protein
MTQADSVLSTPPTNTSAHQPLSSRRGFLVQAAGVAAGSAALGMALPLPAPAATPQGVPDPILAAIEAHKAAFADVIKILDRHTALERELPVEKCRSYATLESEVIQTDDDPRWIECERAVIRAWLAEGEAAIELVNIRPTTLVGLTALLQHAVVADPDGETWPRGLISDDGKRTRSWHHFLIENVAAVLPELVLV